MAEAAPRTKYSGLRVIAVIKLLKAALLLVVGFGSYHYVNRDFADVARGWAHHLSVDPENRLVNWLYAQIANVQPEKLRNVGGWSLLLAADQIAEGIGLWFNQAWAKYLLLAATPIFFGYECGRLGVEIYHGHVTLFHALAVPTSAAILIYLVWVFRADWKRRQAAAHP
jgi:uncharacterized membrane protein (DUF2068 family)